MGGLEILEPTKLYNLLQQGTVYPALSDTNYMLLIDARNKSEYNESHIVTAKKAQKNGEDGFAVGHDYELECKQNVVIYDSNTRELTDKGPAIECGKLLWDSGSRNSVKILKGGYEEFSALYPFLRTQKILFLPREMDDLTTYPYEVLPGFLYLGNWKQGNEEFVGKHLKIKAHVNCCVEPGQIFSTPGDNLIHIPVEDVNDAEICSRLLDVCTFLDKHRESGHAVLVFSTQGISRSVAVIMGYLMFVNKWDLTQAYTHITSTCSNVRPNRGLIAQLSKWEIELYGEKFTDISDPKF